MRLRLNIERHELPPFKLLWRVPSKPLTISALLELLNDSVPLESDGWGLEDYSVSVLGYECLHYQEVQAVLGDLDEVTIRALETTDVRSRSLSGRYQISAAGAHLVDGVPFGKPCLRRPVRPQIYIPPLKRRRLDYDSSFVEDEDEGVEGDGSTSPGSRLISNGVHEALVNGEEDGAQDEDTTSDREQSLQLVKHRPQKLRRTRSDNQKRTVQFDDASQRDNGIAFNIYEDDSDDDEEDFEPDASEESSSSDESEAVANCVDENEDPLQQEKRARSLPNGTKVGENRRSRKRRTQVLESSSSDSSSSDSSSSDSDDDSDDSDSSSSSSSSPAPSKKTPASKIQTNGNAGPMKPQAPTCSNAVKQTQNKPTSSISSKVHNQKAPQAPSAPIVDRTQTPFGQGKAATQSRNRRRKVLKKARRQQSAESRDGEAPHDPIESAQAHQAEEMGAQVDGGSSEIGQDAFETPTQDTVVLQDARDKSVGNNTSTANSSEAAPVQDQPANAHDMPQDVDNVLIPSSDAQPAKPNPKRAKLDVSASRRLLFGSLGVKNPKSKTDEDTLREKLGKKSKENAKAATSQAPATEIPPTETSQVEQPPDPNFWKTRLHVTAVECVEDGVTLSAPPFPFVQRWDKSCRPQGKKQNKRKLAKGHQLTISAEDTTAYYPDEAADTTYGADGLNYDETPTYNEQTTGSQPQKIVFDEEEDEGFPPLPTDPSTLHKLHRENCMQNTIIAFKQLEVSKATSWSPQISPFRRARIESFDPEADVIVVMFAHADNPNKAERARYDEIGRRVYEGFEAPSDSDEGQTSKEGHEIQFDDLLEAHVLQSATKASAEAPSASSSSSQSDNEQEQAQLESQLVNESIIPDSLPPQIQDSLATSAYADDAATAADTNGISQSQDLSQSQSEIVNESQDILTNGGPELPAAQAPTQLSKVTLSNSASGSNGGSQDSAVVEKKGKSKGDGKGIGKGKVGMRGGMANEMRGGGSQNEVEGAGWVEAEA